MSMKWLVRCLLVFGVVGMFLLAGCGSSDSVEPPAVTVSELAGTWLDACQPETGGSGVDSRLSAIAIDAAGAITLQEYEWNNTDACDGGPSRFQRNLGTLTIPGGNVLTTFGNAAKADLTASLSELTLFDPGTISQYNTEVAYGFNDWAQGVAKNITNLDYDGSAQPSIMKTLMMRSGETLFVGDDSVLDADGYPTAIRPNVSRVPDVAVTGAALTGEWSGTCRQEDNSDYGITGGAAVEYITVGASSITVNTTYYSDPYCDQTGSGGQPAAQQEAIETLTFNYDVSGTTNLLTELGMATGVDLTVTAHSITPVGAAAVAALNGDTAYGFADWALDTMKPLAPSLQHNGTTGSTAMKIAALMRGDRFYVRGGEPATEIPYGSAGYPLTVGATPLLRSHDISTTALLTADLAGSWYAPCHEVSASDWRTDAIVVSGGSVYHREWQYPTGTTTTCDGQPEVVFNYLYTPTVQDNAVPTDRGTATELQLVTPGLNTACMLLMRVGNRLYAAVNEVAVDGTCTTGVDYPVDVSDNFTSLETTPVTTLPLGTYRSLCVAEASSSRMDYIVFHGNAMSGSTINYSPATDCTGTISTHDRFSAVISFGTTVAMTEGAATQISAIDETGATMLQIVKWMDDLIWTGVEFGGAYPIKLNPAEPLLRIY